MSRKPKIVTIIAGFENADVLPFTARAPLKFSDMVVFVDGIRPILRRKDPEIRWDSIRSKPYSTDKTAQVALDLGITYINPNRALYNGTKINMGIESCKAKLGYFDSVLYLEADEAIDPIGIPKLLEFIKDKPGIMVSTFDLIQLWDDFTGFRVNPSCSKLLNTMHLQFPEGDEGHNSTAMLNIGFANVIPDVPMYHLHEFRKNCMPRVRNGLWRGGGDGGGIAVEEAKFKLRKTSFLKEIYGKLKFQDKREVFDTYIGKVKRRRVGKATKAER